MIIVLEGPTAAGKTTWGLMQAGAVLVPETEAGTQPPTGVQAAARLGTPLRGWYTAIEELRPGSVAWQFPEGGIGGLTVARRPRHDVETFDAPRRASGARHLVILRADQLISSGGLAGHGHPGYNRR